MGKSKKPDLLDWLGLKRKPDFSKAQWLGGLISVAAILIIGAVVILTLGRLLYALVDVGSTVDQSAPIRNYALLLAAIIGVPFLVWRSFVAQKQVDVAEQGQITDRINNAVQGLGAEKTVKDGEDDKTVPNIEVRVGAIYALERIAQDSERDHIQIMEILCAYIRENAPADSAVTFITETDEEPDADEIRAWARQLEGPRTDIRVALEVIGRRSKKQIALERVAEVRGSTVGYRLDLRDTCVQGVDISELDFDHALFDKAQMRGADLIGAQMDEKTSLSAATLRGAALREVDFTTVSFSQDQVDEIFGDGSVKLPDVLVRPDWPPEVLEYDDFITQWRAWQKKIGYDPSKDTP